MSKNFDYAIAIIMILFGQAMALLTVLVAWSLGGWTGHITATFFALLWSLIGMSIVLQRLPVSSDNSATPGFDANAILEILKNSTTGVNKTTSSCACEPGNASMTNTEGKAKS